MRTATVPVGATPRKHYANWDEHREALRADAEARRAAADARRNIVQRVP